MKQARRRRHCVFTDGSRKRFPWASFNALEGAVDLEACRRLGIDVTRRPTGGRAILHTAEEVTFSLIVSAARAGHDGSDGRLSAPRHRHRRRLAVAGIGGPPGGTYGRFAGGGGGAGDPACFAVKARCDLVVGKSKLVGSAEVQQRGVILQQNSLPLRLQAERWSQVFLRAALAPEATGLWEAVGREIPAPEVAAALRGGFRGSFRRGLSGRDSHRGGALPRRSARSAGKSLRRRLDAAPGAPGPRPPGAARTTTASARGARRGSRRSCGGLRRSLFCRFHLVLLAWRI